MGVNGETRERRSQKLEGIVWVRRERGQRGEGSVRISIFLALSSIFIHIFCLTFHFLKAVNC